MNNWKYANRSVPTDSTDGYSGQNSIVRELQLAVEPSGHYSLLSTPVNALSNYSSSPISFDDKSVDGSFLLPWTGRAYKLELDISWDTATNVGVSVGRSSDGSRNTNLGKFRGSCDSSVGHSRPGITGF